MDEYIAALASSSSPAPSSSSSSSSTSSSSSPVVTNGGRAAPGPLTISLPLWTTERLVRLGESMRTLYSRHLNASALTATAIYNEMNDPDPRLSPWEVLSFLLFFLDVRRCLNNGVLPNTRNSSSRHRPELGMRRKPHRVIRFSPYNNIVSRQELQRPGAGSSTSFVWSLKTHRRFLDAVERLGGVDIAKPSAVLQLMKDEMVGDVESNINGLTSGDVSRHLVGFRNLLAGGEKPGRSSSEDGGSASGIMDHMLDFFGDLKLT